MKKYLSVILLLFAVFNFYSQEMDYANLWNSKTLKEKNEYLNGIIDTAYEICLRIDQSIAKAENEKKITTLLANEIESPIGPYIFLVGNVQTNGIDSLIIYLDERYAIKQFKKYSALSILYNKAKQEYLNRKE
jgi:hypothetical protein